MRCFVPRVLCAIGSTVLLAVGGLASPVSGKLLSLVPPGCAIVAGFENGHGPHSGGRLLLSTPNNQFDLDDWLALAGVDTQKRYDEVIEAAAPNSTGELANHLLLVEGRFDRERIFRAAQQNGAQTSQAEGETFLVVKPFPRERVRMPDTRWLAILNNRTALFGTPSLVQQALRRYVTQAEADSALMQRLKLLRPDIRSWNVLVSLHKLIPNFKAAGPQSDWSRLLEDMDLLLVGAHFGSRIRIDFSLNAGSDRETAYFGRKADLLKAMFTLETVPPGELPQQPQPQLENLVAARNEVRGSVELSDKQFTEWMARQSHARASQAPDRPMTIAETQ
jgi:hypothetical protein